MILSSAEGGSIQSHYEAGLLAVAAILLAFRLVQREFPTNQLDGSVLLPEAS
jgi:hypothetical protein